jgi:hypothetical protein
MSLIYWYLYKSEQCARMAKYDPRGQSYSESERKAWLRLAEDALNDGAIFPVKWDGVATAS